MYYNSPMHGTPEPVEAPTPNLEPETAVYRAALLPRRGEFVAWGLALLSSVAWVALLLLGQRVPLLVWLMTLFFVLAAASISLGNWMDRRSSIRLQPDGVIFENGLRHTHLHWNEINQVQIFPSGWGKKVRVIGSKAYFGFRTLGEVKYQGEVKGRMGFEAGEKILMHILNQTGLKGPVSIDNGYYYSRE